MKRRGLVGALAGAVITFALFGGAHGASGAATSCTLVPVLREATVNQGLGSYPKLVRGKETLVRLYMSLPSCASRSASIQITAGSLSVASGATAISSSLAPTPAVSTTSPPALAPYGSAAALDSTADLKFVVPGADLARPAGAYTATFTASVGYRTSAGATGTVSLPASGQTAVTKDVAGPTNALRVLVVPMGDVRQTFSAQFPDSARTAVVNGMQTLSRMFPLRDGVGDLASTTAGLRYTINPTLIDVGANPFCGTAANFSAFKALLAQTLQSWNTANAATPADRVLGVVSSSISNGGSSGCAEGMASTNSPEAWVRAIPDGTTPSMTGALMGMEIAHTFGIQPTSRSDGAFHSIYVNADTTAPNRGYNVSARSFLSDDHTVMTLSGAWNNATTILERDDWADVLCKLGGPTTASCTAPGTVGVAGGDPTFVISGTTDGTQAGTSVVESYFATGVPRSPSPAAPTLTLVLLDGRKTVASYPVGLGSAETLHAAAAGAPNATIKLFSAAVPFDTRATRIELRNGTAVLYARDRTAPPTVASTTLTAGGGGTPANYSSDAGIDDYQPAVSPDGKWIAWAKDFDGPVLVVAPSSGGAAFTRIPGGETWSDFGTYQPAWNPAGTKLAYAGVSYGQTGDLFVVPVDTSGATASFGTPQKVYDADGASSPYAGNPTWSPDGSTLAFDADGDIWTIPAAGGTPARLTTSGDASNPSWSRSAGDARIVYERAAPAYFAFKRGLRRSGAAATGARAKTVARAEQKQTSRPATKRATRSSRHARAARPRPTLSRRPPRSRQVPLPRSLQAFRSARRAGATTLVSTTYTVNSSADSGDGVCDAIACTLREAITAANANSGSDTILFDLAIGDRSIKPATPLPPITDAVTIDGTSVSGYTASPLVELDGSLTVDAQPGGCCSNVGLAVSAANTTIRALVVNRFNYVGVQLAATNGRLEGSYVGTDAGGVTDLGNRIGVYVGGSGNVVGGAAAGDRNVIVGSDTSNVELYGSANTIQGNYVGLAADGITGRGSCYAGIEVWGSSNVIRDNVVSANAGPCGYGGEQIELRSGAASNTIRGNLIGTDATGTQAVAGGGTGIRIGRLYDSSGGPSDNLVGGTTPGAGNVIASPTGIAVYGSGTKRNAVLGNWIGVTATGAAIGATNGIGVGIFDASDNVVGGAAAGAANVIGFKDYGVWVSGATATGNAVRANSITARTLGIDLGGDGVTANDPGDADTGPNNLQNFPVLTSATAGGGTAATGTLDSEANKTYALDFFASTACTSSGYGPGSRYLGSTSAATDGSGNASFSAAGLGATSAGEYVTATATDSTGNTSEFSACFQLAGAPAGGPYAVNTTADPGNGTCDASECTLREAIAAANANAGADTITFAIPSSMAAGGIYTITPASPGLPQITGDTTVDATTQTGWTATSGPVVALDGASAGAGAAGFWLTAGSSTIRGFAIGGFSSNGITIEGTSASNVIQGNYIGTNAAGTARNANQYGVFVATSGNLVGVAGGEAWRRNVISGNGDGVRLGPEATGNRVAGNYVGTDRTGTAAIPNANGVVVDGDGNVVGGTTTTSGTGNLASGNTVDGITLLATASGNEVSANLVGVKAGENGALGNGGDGISVLGAGNTVGGTAPFAGNVVGSNAGHGIFLYGSTGNVVRGNNVGVGSDGTTAFRNGIDGIAVDGGSGHTIAGNLTAYNTNQGIALFGVDFPGGTSGNTVRGNTSRNNGGHGILVGNSSTTTIGGLASGEGNTVYGNGGAGVAIAQAAPGTATGNAIRGNAVSANGGLGIDLTPLGVTPNDAGDADTGPNGLQNFPVVTSATNGASGTAITGTLNSAPNATYAIDLYSSSACDPSGYGEAGAYRATTSVTTDGSGNGSFAILVGPPLGVGELVTATATDAAGNTSELSACTAVGAGVPAVSQDELWTVDPAQGQSSAAKLAGSDNGHDPYWTAAGTILFDRFDGSAGRNDVLSLPPAGGTASPVVADASWPSSAGGALAFHRRVASGVESSDLEVFVIRGASTITVQASDDRPQDTRLDVFLRCGSTSYPVAVGIPPSATTEAGATFEYRYDPSLACAGGTITVSVSDGYWRAVPASGGTAPVSTEDGPPAAAIYVPFAGLRLLQFSNIPLVGAGNDPEDGALSGSRLQWTLSGPGGTTRTGSGSVVDLSPPAGGWAPGTYTARLTVSDAAGHSATATADVEVLPDGDNDGVEASKDPDTGCSGQGADGNPFNGYEDYDGDGTPNADEALLGTPVCAGSAPAPTPATATFDPKILYVPSNGNTVTVYVKVPGKNLYELVGGSIRITKLAGGRPARTYSATTDPDFFDVLNIAWSVSGDTGTAKFDRQALNAFLAAKGLDATTVTFTIAGRSSQPPWRFETSGTFTTRKG